MTLKNNFFDKYWNNSGGFKNNFELKRINDAEVVYDYATNLIWQQSGSKNFKNLRQARRWINKLNANEYAGIKKWRLPTLEEALSLMENKKMNNNLYIDPVFDSWQWCILTGDSLDLHKNWLVAFSGRVDWFDADVQINYVRLVSPMKN